MTISVYVAPPKTSLFVWLWWSLVNQSPLVVEEFVSQRACLWQGPEQISPWQDGCGNPLVEKLEDV